MAKLSGKGNKKGFVSDLLQDRTEIFTSGSFSRSVTTLSAVCSFAQHLHLRLGAQPPLFAVARRPLAPVRSRLKFIKDFLGRTRPVEQPVSGIYLKGKFYCRSPYWRRASTASLFKRMSSLGDSTGLMFCSVRTWSMPKYFLVE